MRTGMKKHIAETIKLAIPVSIGQLGHIMMGVIDSLMVGRVGTDQLAASALVNSLFFLVVVLGLGMTMAITPLVAIAKGRKDDDECGIILRQSLVVNLVFSVVLLVLVFLGADMIKYMDQTPRVTEYAESYMKILAFSVIPFLGFQVYRQFLEGISLVKPPMYIAIFSNTFNALFNWVFIYGHFGFDAMGLDGAGVSTLLSRIIMVAIIIVYVIKAKGLQKYDPSLRFRKLDWKLMKKIIHIGLPSGFQYFLEIAAFSFSAVMIGWLGAAALAAHQIAMNLAAVSYMIILGISAAGTIRVGNAVGQKDRGEVRKAGFTALVLADIVMFGFAIIFILFRYQLPQLYVENEAVIKLASSLLIIASLFQLFDGLQATAVGILRGLTDVKLPLIISFCSYWLIGLPVGYYLGFVHNLGTLGVWVGFLVGLICVGISLTFRFNYLTKRGKLYQFS